MYSILSNKEECYLCGSTQNLELHHIMNHTSSKIRKESEKWGGVVYLCDKCHRTAPYAVHRDSKRLQELKKVFQANFELLNGEYLWMKTFHKNYK